MLRRLAAIIDRLRFWFGEAGDLSRLTFDPAAIPIIGIAVGRTGECTAHSGVVYMGPSQTRMFLHLADHKLLLRNTCKGKYIYAIPDFEIEDLIIFSGICELVYNTNQGGKIPYSFEFDPDISFDPKTGEFMAGRTVDGLSCSTFVIALFRSFGQPLVNEITWPDTASASDLKARQAFLDWLNDTDRQERANEIAPTMTKGRISPQQVCGAAIQKKLPVGYLRATDNGMRVMRIFDERYPDVS
jgi:hypothetical protein